MPFADLTTVIVTGTYLGFDGIPAWGTVTFDAPTGVNSLLDPVGHQIVVPRRLVARLDLDGHISIAVPATDDPDLLPQGWTFTVTEVIFDPSATLQGQGGGLNVYQIEVPYDTVDGTLDLSQAPHVGASNGQGGSIVVESIDDVLFWMGVYDGIGVYR